MTATRPNPPAGWSNPCIAPALAKGQAAIRLSHLTGPTCWWSWGYEATLNRIRLVYGNQIDFNVALAPVYEDLDHWLKHNGLTREGWAKWATESQQRMGVPIYTAYDEGAQPQDTTQATLAVLAAGRQAPEKGDRFLRAILRRAVVEGADVTKTSTLRAAAEESGLDVKRFEADLKDTNALTREMGARQGQLPNLPLGFYNLALQDGRGRTLVIDHAFDPKAVEDAIEFLTGGTLRKNTPNDPVQYVTAAGPTPTIELARAFAWSVADTERKLQALVKQGRVRTLTLGGSVFWAAPATPLQVTR